MNALEAKSRQAHFAALVEGDPISRALDRLLEKALEVRLAELAATLGHPDTNRIVHHLLARGFEPAGEGDAYTKRPWYLQPFPTPAQPKQKREVRRGAEHA